MKHSLFTRLFSLMLSFLLLTAVFCCTSVAAAEKDNGADSKANSHIQVKLTATCREPVKGFWFSYTINGIPYRSDEVGLRFNQVAIDNMTDEEKVSVLDVFYYAKKTMWSQMGKDYADKLSKWYLEYSGWQEAANILSTRLAAKSFPEYQERFGKDIDAYFNEYFMPQCVKDGDLLWWSDYPELAALYEEEKLVFTWAISAYGGMVTANNIRTRLAVQSISGDLIQLITDKALVPNITPAGTGGVSTTIATTIFDYVAAISGITDDIQDMAVGKRVRAGQAREIIDKMSETIDKNEAIIRQCTERAHAIQKEIDQRYPAMKAALEKREKEREKKDEEDRQAALNASPITNEPNASISSTNASYNARLLAIQQSDYDNIDAYNAARQDIIDQKTAYNQSIYNTAMAEMLAWCNHYFGAIDGELTDTSVIGKFKNSVPEESYEYMHYFIGNVSLNIYMSDAEVAEVEQGLKKYYSEAKQLAETTRSRGEYAKETAIAARKEYNEITEKLRAVVLNGVTTVDNHSRVMDNIYKGTYVNLIDSFADLNEDYNHSTNWHVGVIEDRVPAVEKDYALKKQARDDALKDFHYMSDDYNKSENRFCEDWEELNDLYNQREMLVNSLPSYVTELMYHTSSGENVLYIYDYNQLGKKFLATDATGTAGDAAQISEETSNLLHEINAISCQMDVAANDIIETGRVLRVKSARLGSAFFEKSKSSTEWSKLKVKYDPDEKVYYDRSSTENYYFNEYQIDYSSGSQLKLRLVRDDFSGRQYLHKWAMNRFFDLCENYDSYASSGNNEYVVLRNSVLQADASRGMNSYSAKVLGTRVPNEPDPVDDLLIPMIRSVDAVRISAGDLPANLYTGRSNYCDWVYNPDTKTLTITEPGTGTGEMADYGTTENRPPWRVYDIQHVVFGEGVTVIGKNAFFGYSVETVTFPVSLRTIGVSAFQGCDKLKNVYYYGSEEDWAQVCVEDKNDELKKTEIHFDHSSTNNKESSSISIKSKSVTYNGKAVNYKASDTTVKGSSGKVSFAYYTDDKCTNQVQASNVKNAGTYYVKAIVAADQNYNEATSEVVKLTINKAKNRFAIKNANRSINAGKTAAGVKVSNKGTGNKTYKISAVKKKKYARYFKINSRNGKITVNRKTPKGKYVVTIKAKAAPTVNYEASSWKTAKVTVNVK